MEEKPKSAVELAAPYVFEHVWAMAKINQAIENALIKDSKPKENDNNSPSKGE